MIEFPEINHDKIYIKDYENGIICKLNGGDGEYYLNRLDNTEFSGDPYGSDNEIFEDPRGKWYMLDNLEDLIKFLQGDRNFKRVLPVEDKFKRYYLKDEEI